jgi:phage RecT family recombinase
MTTTTQQTESKAIAKVEPKRDALSLVASQIRGRKAQLAEELPRHLTPERMLALAVGEFRRNPQLNQCSPASLISAIVDAGRLGLEVDHNLGRAYLVPRRDKERGLEATLIVGYKGLLDLAYRSGMVAAIDTAAVYEGDKFYYVLGLTPELKHRPRTDDRGDAKLTHAYAVARLQTGSAIFEVMTRGEIEEIRKWIAQHDVTTQHNIAQLVEVRQTVYGTADTPASGHNMRITRVEDEVVGYKQIVIEMKDTLERLNDRIFWGGWIAAGGMCIWMVNTFIVPHFAKGV